jgi:adenylate kinase
MPSQQEGVCDICSGDLIRRDDESPEVIRTRLVVYEEQTRPLLDFYRRRELLREIDGTIGVDNVVREIERIVEPAPAARQEQRA